MTLQLPIAAAPRETLPWSAYAPLVPGLVFLALFLVVPLCATLWLSLSPNVLVAFAGPGLDNFAYLLGKAYYLDVLVRTVRIASVTTAIALLLGYPAAYVLRDVSERLGSTMIIGLTFPILAGPLVVVLGWMTLFAVLKQIPSDALEAARSLGAGRVQVLRHVVWPLSLPGVVSAALIAFSLAASSYVSPHYLGGATQLTLTTLVAQFILATFNSELAGAAAAMLLVLMAIIIFGFTKLTARAIRA